MIFTCITNIVTAHMQQPFYSRPHSQCFRCFIRCFRMTNHVILECMGFHGDYQGSSSFSYSEKQTREYGVTLEEPSRA